MNIFKKITLLALILSSTNAMAKCVPVCETFEAHNQRLSSAISRHDPASLAKASTDRLIDVIQQLIVAEDALRGGEDALLHGEDFYASHGGCPESLYLIDEYRFPLAYTAEVYTTCVDHCLEGIKREPLLLKVRLMKEEIEKLITLGHELLKERSVEHTFSKFTDCFYYR